MGSGYTRAVDLANTFVSTHATGARSHTPRERAHSPRQLQTARSAARPRTASASLLGAHLDLQPGSARGAWLPGAQALRTRAMLSAALTACERPILPWKGSVGAGDREGVKSSARWLQGRRGRSEYRAELGSLRTLFLSLRRARSNMSPSHRHPYSLPHLLFLL